MFQRLIGRSCSGDAREHAAKRMSAYPPAARVEPAAFSGPQALAGSDLAGFLTSVCPLSAAHARSGSIRGAFLSPNTYIRFGNVAGLSSADASAIGLQLGLRRGSSKLGAGWDQYDRSLIGFRCRSSGWA
jgi:hypothetical protein